MNDLIVYASVILFILIVAAAWVACCARTRDLVSEIRAGGDEIKDLKAAPRTKSEQLAIDTLEKITGAKFPSVNPSWLRWYGRTLELDGYNEDLKLALEYNGPLHTKWQPNFESRSKFDERQKKDAAKIAICRDNGVDLIVVDAGRVPPRHMYSFIASRLYDLGHIEFPPPNYIAPEPAAV